MLLGKIVKELINNTPKFSYKINSFNSLFLWDSKIT